MTADQAIDLVRKVSPVGERVLHVGNCKPQSIGYHGGGAAVLSCRSQASATIHTGGPAGRAARRSPPIAARAAADHSILTGLEKLRHRDLMRNCSGPPGRYPVSVRRQHCLHFGLLKQVRCVTLYRLESPQVGERNDRYCLTAEVDHFIRTLVAAWPSSHRTHAIGALRHSRAQAPPGWTAPSRPGKPDGAPAHRLCCRSLPWSPPSSRSPRCNRRDITSARWASGMPMARRSW